MGGEPTSTSGPDWSVKVVDMVRDMSSTQHVVTSIIAHLPQPGAGVGRPTTCKVIANGLASLVREVRGGSLMQNGGRYELEMVRMEGVEGNPWRIEKQKAVLLWEKGNLGVFLAPK